MSSYLFVLATQILQSIDATTSAKPWPVPFPTCLTHIHHGLYLDIDLFLLRVHGNLLVHLNNDLWPHESGVDVVRKDVANDTRTCTEVHAKTAQDATIKEENNPGKATEST